MVAGFEEGEQRHGDGGKAGADDLAAGAALDFRHHIFQRPMGRGTADAVGELAGEAVGAAGLAGGDIRHQQGRAAMHRRVDEAVAVGRGAAGVRQAGEIAVLAAAGVLVVGHRVSSVWIRRG